MSDHSTMRLANLVARYRKSFEHYAQSNLKILAKPDDATGARSLATFTFNSAQRLFHTKVEEMQERLGYVRAIVLKGRQQGISTYTQGRYYWRTTMWRGVKTYILTHQQQATDNLFGMVERFEKNANPLLTPNIGRSSAKELFFDKIDSQYQVATAGSKGAGRSATLTHVHGSEVGFWENGESHLGGMLQAVPLAPGTEVILESTANGLGNVFHKQWILAERGLSDFIPIFIPWFLQTEYRRVLPADFTVSDSRDDVPEGELSEREYQKAFGLDDAQILWRRKKIFELGGGDDGFMLFKQEYPATPDEAFQSSSGRSLINRGDVLRARKSSVQTEGKLIIGVDPAGGDPEGDSTAIIRRRTRRAFGLQKFNNMNTMQLVAVINKIIETEKPDRIFIDVGGLGKGVVDRLAEFPSARAVVVPVNFGESALDAETYVNRRVEMYYELMAWLSDVGGANIPDDDGLQATLLSVIRDHDDSNQRKRLMSKKWMRSQGFRSPDEADALALTFAEPWDMYHRPHGPETSEAPLDFDAFGGAGIDNVVNSDFSGFG